MVRTTQMSSSRYRRQSPAEEPRSISEQEHRRAPRHDTHASRSQIWTILTIALLAQQGSSTLTLHPRDTVVPLRVTNNCAETIWPAILTQSGAAPPSSGFELRPGDTNPQEVSGDWRGRVWARTNCSFPSDGGPASGQGGAACETGDCGMFVECQGAVSYSPFPKIVQAEEAE